jgi:hypothetical protein
MGLLGWNVCLRKGKEMGERETDVADSRAFLSRTRRTVDWTAVIISSLEEYGMQRFKMALKCKAPLSTVVLVAQGADIPIMIACPVFCLADGRLHWGRQHIRPAEDV